MNSEPIELHANLLSKGSTLSRKILEKFLSADFPEILYRAQSRPPDCEFDIQFFYRGVGKVAAVDSMLNVNSTTIDSF